VSFDEWENEEWEFVLDFPDYAISNMGRICRSDTGQMIRTSTTQHGHVKVSLSLCGRRYTRSVAVLTALAFVEAPDPTCDAVIALNGNLSDLRATNLAWRTQSFAWRWANQFKRDWPAAMFSSKIFENHSGEHYSCPAEAAHTLGLLYSDVWSSCITGRVCTPGDYVFSFVK
jgi:hypothetical protein